MNYKGTKVPNHILICTTIPITFFGERPPQTQGLEGGPNPNSGFCTRCDAPKLDPRSPQELPRSSQDAPKLPTRSHQELPRSPQDAPKLVPRSHQKVPKLDTRCSQVGHILICTTIPITFFWRKAPTDLWFRGGVQAEFLFLDQV